MFSAVGPRSKQNSSHVSKVQQGIRIELCLPDSHGNSRCERGRTHVRCLQGRIHREAQTNRPLENSRRSQVYQRFGEKSEVSFL